MFRSSTDYEKMRSLLEKKSQSDDLKKLVKLTAEFDNAKAAADIKRLQDEINNINKNLSTPEYKALRDQVEKVIVDYEKKSDALFKKALKRRAKGKSPKKSSKSLDEKKVQKILEKKFVLSGATHAGLSSQDEARLQMNPSIIDLQKKVTALYWLQKWSEENSMIFYDKLSVATLDESRQLLSELKDLFRSQALSGGETSLNQVSIDPLLNRINNQLMEIEKLLENEIQTSEVSSKPNPVAILDAFNRKETREGLKAVVPEFESYWGDLMEKKQLPSLQATKVTKRSDASAISKFGLMSGGVNTKLKVPLESRLEDPAGKLKKIR